MIYFPQDSYEFKIWITDLQEQYPHVYEMLEKHFKLKEADRKLGALLDYNDTSSRRSSAGVASNPMVKSGSSRDKGTK